MRSRATVVVVLPEGMARLAVRRESACSGDCHKCGGCGGTEQTIYLTARNAICAQKGDIVYVESRSDVVLKGALLLYLLPLALLLAGYLIAMPLGGWAFLIALGGFALGLLPAALYNRRLKKRPPDYVIVGFVE